MAGRLILAALVAVAGCSSYEPRPDPFRGLEMADTAVQRPAPLPERPDPVLIEHEGVEYAAFDADGRRQLNALYETAKANTGIAEVNAGALAEAKLERNGLLIDGRNEYELAEVRGRLLHEERAGTIIRRAADVGVCVLGIWGAAQ